MLYWDSSALLACLIREKRSSSIESFLLDRSEELAYTSIITPLEIESAIQRRTNDRSLSPREALAVRHHAADFRKKITFIIADFNALDLALHMQKIYQLRPGDALQLASARLGTTNPVEVTFLSLDERLNEAATQEGFHVLL